LIIESRRLLPKYIRKLILSMQFILETEMFMIIFAFQLKISVQSSEQFVIKQSQMKFLVTVQTNIFVQSNIADVDKSSICL